MALVFYLSGESIELAKEEVLALIPNSDYKLYKRVLVADSKYSKILGRLAFTRKICKLLFSCPADKLLACFRKYPWESVYRKNFSIRITNLTKEKSPYSEKGIARFIWNAVKNPEVNLKAPKTPVEVILANNKAFACLLIHENNENYSLRRPHLRPGFSPVSLHPKLARAIVNLTGIRKGVILDPFCGTGGLLIEAALMGLKAEGYDISNEKLKNSAENLAFLKIKNAKIKKQDATSFNKKFNYIATDLPYGKSTGVKNLNSLYLNFLKNLRKNLKKRAVVVFPHFVNYKSLVKKAKLKIKKEFSIYIHKSLTRKIVVVEP